MFKKCNIYVIDKNNKAVPAGKFVGEIDHGKHTISGTLIKSNCKPLRSDEVIESIERGIYVHIKDGVMFHLKDCTILESERSLSVNNRIFAELRYDFSAVFDSAYLINIVGENEFILQKVHGKVS